MRNSDRKALQMLTGESCHFKRMTFKGVTWSTLSTSESQKSCLQPLWMVKRSLKCSCSYKISQGKGRKKSMHYLVQRSNDVATAQSTTVANQRAISDSRDSILIYWHAQQAKGLPWLTECMGEHPELVHDPAPSAVLERCQAKSQAPKAVCSCLD